MNNFRLVMTKCFAERAWALFKAMDNKPWTLDGKTYPFIAFIPKYDSCKEGWGIIFGPWWLASWPTSI